MNENKLIRELIQLCGEKNIIYSERLMSGYLEDWRKRYHGKALAVVFPGNTEEIQELVKFCQREQIAITTQGGNTSTCGGATPLTYYTKPQIIINLKRMNKILNIDKDNLSMTVEAGCTLQQIKDHIKQYNLCFPLSLASQGSCQIGGNLATNAGGTQVLKYGMIRDLTLGLQAVLPNGETLDQLYSLRKNNTYIDLKQLLIGSEGTLGIITHASLKLRPRTIDYFTCMVEVNNLKEAIDLLHKLQESYNNAVSAFEIIKHDTWQIYQTFFPTPQISFNMPWLILIELEVNNDFQKDNVINKLQDFGINFDNCIVADSEKTRQFLWKIREEIPLAEKQFGYAAKHDISLPISKLEEFITLNQQKLLEIEPSGYFSIFGHLGDGNLHYNFGIKNSTQEQIGELEKKVNHLVYKDVIYLGGSISAEHGIGQAKKEWLKYFQNKTAYNLMKQIKNLIDPNDIFNPGKVFIDEIDHA